MSCRSKPVLAHVTQRLCEGPRLCRVSLSSFLGLDTASQLCVPRRFVHIGFVSCNCNVFPVSNRLLTASAGFSL